MGVWDAIKSDKCGWQGCGSGAGTVEPVASGPHRAWANSGSSVGRGDAPGPRAWASQDSAFAWPRLLRPEEASASGFGTSDGESIEPGICRTSACLSERAFECVLELQNAQGTQLKLHLRGSVAPDLSALSSVFWSSAR